MAFHEYPLDLSKNQLSLFLLSQNLGHGRLVHHILVVYIHRTELEIECKVEIARVDVKRI
jgi:hypothetical protein